jgi:predicted nucleotidyltransferase
MQPRIPIDQAKIEAFCQKWKIVEFSLFGSVLREDFGPESDVDVLVTFAPDSHWTVFDFMRCEDELEQALGRKVDLVERVAVEQSSNYIRRKHILSSAQRYYVA